MNSKKPSHIIIDSSVVAKWFFPSEQDSEAALRIRDLFLSKELTISVPVLIYYEINNLIKTAIKNLRINEDLAKEAYQGFLELNLITYSSQELMNIALEKAISLDISSYDASYLALAENLGIPLLTADQKFIDKVKSNFVHDLKASWVTEKRS